MRQENQSVRPPPDASRLQCVAICCARMKRAYASFSSSGSRSRCSSCRSRTRPGRRRRRQRGRLQDPTNWPNDPDFGGTGTTGPSCLTLKNQVDAVTKQLGTGMHLDRAWAKTHGDPRVLIAVTDSGIDWYEADLINQLFSEPGRAAAADGLPRRRRHQVRRQRRRHVQRRRTTRPTTGHMLPAGGDDVRPARQRQEQQRRHRREDLDPRRSPTARTTTATATSTTSAAGTSSTTTTIRSTTPRFGHGTGASKDGFAEGNNGKGGIGVCPDCTVMMLRVGDAFVPELNPGRWRSPTRSTSAPRSSTSRAAAGSTTRAVARRDRLRL